MCINIDFIISHTLNFSIFFLQYNHEICFKKSMLVMFVSDTNRNDNINLRNPIFSLQAEIQFSLSWEVCWGHLFKSRRRRKLVFQQHLFLSSQTRLFLEMSVLWVTRSSNSNILWTCRPALLLKELYWLNINQYSHDKSGNVD